MKQPPITAKFTAGVDLLLRTGMMQFQIRYCGSGDDAKEPPIAWVAVAIYSPTTVFECAAAGNPERAVMRLCEQLLDGGTCTHCKRPSAFDDDVDDAVNQQMSAGLVCWYMWDPELATFRRGCE